MKPILMIDDDTELCEMVGEYLALEGFRVSAQHDGAAGLESASGGDYEAILLDVMLPKLSGFEVLKRLRGGGSAGADTPVMMLTARGQAVDRIVGLEVGADDYLPKPFDERELVARLRAILRRVRPASETPSATTDARELLNVGDLNIDGGARTATCNGQMLNLTAVEFDLLTLLAQSAGEIVTRETISKRILDRQLSAFDRSVDTHISRLRRKIGTYPNDAERVKTVRSVGYIYALPPVGDRRQETGDEGDRI